MADKSGQGQVIVPLWTILGAMGTVGVSAWAWLFHRVMELEYRLLEIYRLVDQFTNT